MNKKQPPLKKKGEVLGGGGSPDGYFSQILEATSPGQQPGQQPAYYPRLMELFSEIEREFKAIHDENLELKARLRAYEDGPLSTPPVASTPSSVSSLVHSESTHADLSETVVRRAPSKFGIRTPMSRLSTQKQLLYRSQWEISHEYSGHRDGVFEVTTCPSKPVCFATASADRTARIWDYESTICRYNYSGHKGSVNSIRFHATDPFVCSASGDRTVHIWKIPMVVWNHFDKVIQKREESDKARDAEDVLKEKPMAEPTNLSGKTPLHRLQGHTDVVVAACWLGNSRSKVVSGSWDQTLMLWDIGDEKATQVQKLTGHEQAITNIDVHPRDETIISSSRDSTFRIWDPRKATSALSISQGHSSAVTSAIFSPVGNYVVSSSQDRMVKVWDLKFMKAPVAVIRAGAGVSKIAVSSYAGMIAAPLDNGDIRIFDLSGGQIAKIGRSYPGHQKKICGVAWSPDESTLFSCGYTEDVISWVPSMML